MAEVPEPLDLAAEQAGVRSRSALAFLLCAAVLGAAVWWLPAQAEFPADTAERVAFAARASLLVVLWIAVGVRMIARIRFYSAPDNRGSAYAPPSERLKVPLAFLQNTVEQAVLAMVAILALATVDGDAPLAFIVGFVVLFAIGRVTFLFGYPHGAAGRAFGMATTVLPTMAAVVWVIWDMAAKLFLAAA